MEYLNEKLNKFYEEEAERRTKHNKKLLNKYRVRIEKKHKKFIQRKQPKKQPKYLTYIHSKKWREKAKIVKKRDEKCYGCGTNKKLDAHHLHYRNFGQENLNELIALCRSCHEELHYREGVKIKFNEKEMWERLEGIRFKNEHNYLF